MCFFFLPKGAGERFLFPEKEYSLYHKTDQSQSGDTSMSQTALTKLFQLLFW
jgi:hypothetical protein